MSKMRMDNVLITNHSGQQAHLGCQATCYALERMISKRFQTSNVRNDAYDARRSLLKLRFFSNAAIKQLMRSSKSYSYFREADVIIVNGEGMFYAEACQKKRSSPSQRLYEAIFAKRILHKPLWIVNHSVYSNDSRFDKWIANIYKEVDYVAVRERDTLEYLQRLGVSEVKLSADAVFSLEAPEASAQSSWKDKIFITDTSAWPIHYISPHHEKVKILVDRLKQRGVQLDYLSIRTDRRDAHIAEYLGIGYYYSDNFLDFMSQLQTAKFIISGRFHINAFAILCGVPFVAFEANTNKTEALNRLVCHPVPAIDFQKHTLKEVLTLIDDGLALKEQISQGFIKQRNHLCKLAWNNLPTYRPESYK